MASRRLNLQNACNFAQNDVARKNHALYDAATAKMAELGLEPNKRAALAPTAAEGGGSARDILDWIECLNAAAVPGDPDYVTNDDKTDLIALHATLLSKHRAAGG